MQEPSIRSFTLEYYRSLGAELMPLDASARTWEVRLPAQVRPEATPLAISFDPLMESSQVRPMGRTHPHWRKILAACTEARTVAYRHIVAEPVAQIAEHFRQHLPSFGVRSARLVEVRPRAAVGFTHRVTYEAPAMAARHEELHHDLMDAVTGERLEALSDRFYTLHAIPIDPPDDPRHLPIEELHARSTALVDARTEARGYELETELAPRLMEANDRIRRYYEAEVARTLASEEAELDAKLDWLVRRAQETRLPGAIAKLQAEADQVARELDQIRDLRELEAEQLQAIARDREEAERARHEVTIETSLVGVAFVTFDVVTYRLAVALGGVEGTIDVEWIPVIDQLSLPPCPACHAAFATGAGVPSPGWGGYSDTVLVCHGCAPVPLDPSLGDVAPVERPASVECTRCGVSTPVEAVQRCHATGTPYCVVCALTCAECGLVTSHERLRPNPAGRGMICSDHALVCSTCKVDALPRETFVCPGCQERHCDLHALPCPSCGLPRCATCSRGESDGCAACSHLERVESDHPLVKVVQGLMPDLQAGGRRWRAVEVGELAVVEWQDWKGVGGRVLLATQDYVILAQRRRGLFARTWQ